MSLTGTPNLVLSTVVSGPFCLSALDALLCATRKLPILKRLAPLTNGRGIPLVVASEAVLLALEAR